MFENKSSGKKADTAAQLITWRSLRVTHHYVLFTISLANTWWDTSLPSGAHMGHLDELQKAEIVSKSKLVPSVFIKHITELITGNKSHNRGGRYRQVSLYLWLMIGWQDGETSNGISRKLLQRIWICQKIMEMHNTCLNKKSI